MGRVIYHRPTQKELLKDAVRGQNPSEQSLWWVPVHTIYWGSDFRRSLQKIERSRIAQESKESFSAESSIRLIQRGAQTPLQRYPTLMQKGWNYVSCLLSFAVPPQGGHNFPDHSRWSCSSWLREILQSRVQLWAKAYTHSSWGVGTPGKEIWVLSTEYWVLSVFTTVLWEEKKLPEMQKETKSRFVNI